MHVLTLNKQSRLYKHSISTQLNFGINLQLSAMYKYVVISQTVRFIAVRLCEGSEEINPNSKAPNRS